jgi:hypothetical protein
VTNEKPSEMPISDAQQLADRYAAVWNEPDPAARRKAIAELWAPDGRHYVRTLEVQGYEALEQRIIGSHEKNVRIGGNRFRATPKAQALQDAVMFHWEMVPAGGDEVKAVGVEFLILDAQRRIVCDYQFVIS